MGNLRKMRRAKARPAAKKAAIAERNLTRRMYACAYQDKADYVAAEAAIQARGKVMSTFALHLLRKLFKLTRKQILDTNDRVATLSWCLRYSYDAHGNVLKKPMVHYEDIKKQLKEECGYDFKPFPIAGCTKQVAYCRDHLDNGLLALLFAIRVCFSFGKVRLARLAEHIHKLAVEATYEDYIAMAKESAEKLKITTSKSFTEKVVPREMFSSWVYEGATV